MLTPKQYAQIAKGVAPELPGAGNFICGACNQPRNRVSEFGGLQTTGNHLPVCKLCIRQYERKLARETKQDTK